MTSLKRFKQIVLSIYPDAKLVEDLLDNDTISYAVDGKDIADYVVSGESKGMWWIYGRNETSKFVKEKQQ